LGHRTRLGVVLAAVALCAFPRLALAARSVYVDDSACPGAGSGTPALPYCKIQDAICFLKSNGGGTVYVRPGVYKEAIRLFAEFQRVRAEYMAGFRARHGDGKAG